MVLRYSLFFVLMLFYNFIWAEDLDTLLTNLAKAQTSQTAVTPKETPDQAPAAPTVQPEPTPVQAEPKFTPPPPTMMPKSAPTMPTVMPKTMVTPAPAPIEPTINAGAMTPPTATTIASPVIAKGQPQVTVQAGEVSTVSQEGLDTLNIDSSGNWLEKRIWYQKAEQTFEEIRKVLQDASNIRMKFVQAVSVIGKHIDDFYEKAPFEKGQIDELLKAVSDSLSTEEKIRGGDLSSSERNIKLKIHENQQELQSIETQMKMITTLDEQVEKTMIKALHELDACKAFENKAWNNFKDIGLELDDKKARTLYYEMKNFQENIQKKIDYLEHNLYQYLEQQLGSKITQTTSQIESTVQSLKSKSLDLQTLLEKDSSGDLVILKKRDEMEVKQAAAKSAKEVDIKKVSKTSWYQSFWCTYICPIFNKLSEWAGIVLCCIKTLLCKIKEFICRLFGY